MPTIARFMDLRIPADQLREIDGVPLIGKVSVADMRLNYFQDKVDISWKALDTLGKLKIWVATTNNFGKGKPDDYQLFGEETVGKEHAVISVSNIKSPFYKVVIEAPFNTVNRWFRVRESSTEKNK
jgi:hypothetical protein